MNAENNKQLEGLFAFDDGLLPSQNPYHPYILDRFDRPEPNKYYTEWLSGWEQGYEQHLETIISDAWERSPY